MKNFLTKNFKIILATLCALLLACAGLFFVSFSTANAATEVGGPILVEESYFGDSDMAEIPESDLPSDLREPITDEDLSGRTAFFSEIFKKVDTIYAYIKFENDYKLYFEEGGTSMVTSGQIVSLVLKKGSNVVWEIVMSYTQTADHYTYLTVTLPEDLGKITDANLRQPSGDDPGPYFIRISDTYDAATDTPSDVEKNQITEISQTDLPNDLRAVEKGEDLSGKYLFFSLDWFTGQDSSALLELNPGDIVLNSNGFELRYKTNPDNEDFITESFAVESGKIYYCRLPELGTAGQLNPATAEVFKVSDTFSGPADPDDGKTSFGDWFNNLGETVSAWLNDNVGLAISGSGVLVIGGIILFFIIFRKRR